MCKSVLPCVFQKKKKKRKGSKADVAEATADQLPSATDDSATGDSEGAGRKGSKKSKKKKKRGSKGQAAETPPMAEDAEVVEGEEEVGKVRKKR
jgi:hypothetical protein